MTFSAANSARQCDVAAAKDVKRLRLVLERLAEEVTGEGCDPAEVMKVLSEDHLKYLVGPYYGWRGTTAKCRVLIKIEGNELRASAMRGSRPNPDREQRMIYRVAILGSSVLDPVQGLPSGRQYGFFPDRFYFASMLEKKNGKCWFREPDDALYRPPMQNDYYRELERYRKN